MKYPIEDFINKYLIQVQQNMMMNNNNFQNIGMNNNFQMPNMMMNNNNFILNNNEDEEWLKGFQMGVQEVKEEIERERQKLNVVFSTTRGLKTYLVLNYGTTIDEMLRKYLIRVNREDMIGKDGKICFLFNGIEIRFGDKTTVEEFFKNVANPKVVVNDVYNLMG